MDLPSTTLVFDTETTGLPKNYKAPPTDPSHPFITQLAAILYNSTWEPIAEFKTLIQPAGWVIEIEASAKTGITTEHCVRYGMPIELALMTFRHMMERADLSVAHNFSFDLLMTEAAAHRAALPPLFANRPVFCTMKAYTNVVAIKSKWGYKWPTLQETHKFCFGTEFADAHDALADVRACGRVFNHGVRNNLIQY